MQEKLSLLTELIKLAYADGQFKEDEQRFIYAIAQQLGINPKDYTRLFNEYIEFTPPKLEIERIIQFQRLVLLMNVDKNTNKDELSMVQKLGLKLGLNPIAINQVLTEMNNYPNKMVPAERLIEIFKLYHN